ncbi:MAG TPA: class I SAM-dependent methyltransferase [Dehalococcoidia bacterium]|nr:class I SAM-dependent methyltransferase [Dehalococcoidia bacterium]
MTHEAYADGELAALYDLVYAGYDDDLPLYEGFARRLDLPSLELGVGSGRVALHLARQGCQVVGLDASSHMLQRLRDGAAAEPATARRLRLVEGDMRTFDFPGERFGLIYCALDTFEHMLTTADQEAALARVARHLAAGGLFVAEMRTVTAVDWSVEPSPLVAEWTRADPSTGELVTKMRNGLASPAAQTTTDALIFDRIAADGTVRRRAFEVTLRVSGRFEMELVLASAGLRLSAIYGDTSLSPFDDDSDRMIIVAGPS